MSSTNWAGACALATASAFSGAAFYVSAVEHPARLQLDDAAALAQWKPSYKRAAVMQALLAVASAACGVKAATNARGRDARWLWGAGLMFANLPYTLAGIMPTNTKLLKQATGNADSTDKLIAWGKLHFVRTILGVVATGAYACGVAKPL